MNAYERWVGFVQGIFPAEGRNDAEAAAAVEQG